MALEKAYNRSPLPPVCGFPTLRVLSASPTPALTSRSPCFMGLLIGTHTCDQRGPPTFTRYPFVSMPSVRPRRSTVYCSPKHNTVYCLPNNRMMVGNLNFGIFEANIRSLVLRPADCSVYALRHLFFTSFRIRLPHKTRFVAVG